MHTKFWARSLIISHHNHSIESGHLLCICHNFRSRLCKPTAAYNIMWPCNVPSRSAFPSDFPLMCPVLGPCHNFCHSFVVCFAIAFACNASLPFRCHVCCQELLPATQILPLNLPPVLLPRARICQCFFATTVATTVAPVSFLSSMLPCRLPSPLPLPLFLPSKLPWLLPSNLGA